VTIFAPSTCAASTLHAFTGVVVDVHGARAALRGVAADVRAGETQVVAQQLDQQRPRVDRGVDGLAVDGQRKRDGHVLLLRWACDADGPV
jgi:hypothetical protein